MEDGQVLQHLLPNSTIIQAILKIENAEDEPGLGAQPHVGANRTIISQARGGELGGGGIFG